MQSNDNAVVFNVQEHTRERKQLTACTRHENELASAPPRQETPASERMARQGCKSPSILLRNGAVIRVVRYADSACIKARCVWVLRRARAQNITGTCSSQRHGRRHPSKKRKHMYLLPDKLAQRKLKGASGVSGNRCQLAQEPDVTFR